MKEELISFKTAELASELGLSFGFGEGQKFYYHQSKELTENYRGNNYPAPTQSLLQKCLREKYEIDINISLFTRYSYISFVNKHVDKTHVMKIELKSFTGKNYEEALEKALYRGLQLIKELKN